MIEVVQRANQRWRLKSESVGSATAYHALVAAAWLEWRLGATTRGVAMDCLDVDPPGWFAREELGFAFEHGPSLMWTCKTLATANLRALKQLGRESPIRVSYPVGLKLPTREPPPRREAAKPRAKRRRRGGGLACP